MITAHAMALTGLIITHVVGPNSTLKEETRMLIQVVRTNYHYDYVKDFMLDRLIEAHGIVKFKRSTGWVTIGEDLIRGNNRNSAVRDGDRRGLQTPL
jgi:hypothetical protein